MTGKRQAKRQELKSRLINAAAARIGKEGLRGLNARNVTKDAGCALGSLYTAFDDLDDLIIHVNSATLARLAEAVEASRVGVAGPVETLKALAQAYVTFARNNLALWVALFDYASLSGVKIPEWHKSEQLFLIRHIAEPVSELSPDLSEQELLVRSRTLFAAVHGIVTISLEDRFIGLAEGELESELMLFIDQMVAGIDHS